MNSMNPRRGHLLNMSFDTLFRHAKTERFRRGVANTLLLGGLAIMAIETWPHEPPSAAHNRSVEACAEKLEPTPQWVSADDVPDACRQFSYQFKYDYYAIQTDGSATVELPDATTLRFGNTWGPDHDKSAHWGQLRLGGGMAAGGLALYGLIGLRRRMDEVDVVREAETILWMESDY